MWTFLAAEEPASLIVPDSVQKANLAEAVNKIVNMDFSTLFGSLIRESLWILVKVLIALAIYFIGRWLVRRFLRLIDVAMQHRNVDISLRSFTRNTVSAFFTLLLILIVVSTLGVNVTSLIAVASAATLAIGMALSGTAQNFAGGVPEYTTPAEFGEVTVSPQTMAFDSEVRVKVSVSCPYGLRNVCILYMLDGDESDVRTVAKTEPPADVTSFDYEGVIPRQRAGRKVTFRIRAITAYNVPSYTQLREYTVPDEEEEESEQPI